MSKIFKSANGGRNTITIKQNLGDQVHFQTVNDSGTSSGCALSRQDSIAAALKILETIGWPEEDPNSATRQIITDLRCVIEFDERKAKEAADRKELEAEAWGLYLIRNGGKSSYGEFRELSPTTRCGWIDVAKHARELHGGTK